MTDVQLMETSKYGQLALTLEEMQAIKHHFQSIKRDPTDIELETIAQTWSEHCSHKTLKGRIVFTMRMGQRVGTKPAQRDDLCSDTAIAEPVGEE